MTKSVYVIFDEKAPVRLDLLAGGTNFDQRDDEELNAPEDFKHSLVEEYIRLCRIPAQSFRLISKSEYFLLSENRNRL